MSKRNVPLNPQAENIRRDQTATNSPSSLTRGEPNRGTIFEPAGGWPNMLPDADGPNWPAATQFIAPQHANFNAPAYGGTHGNSMDGVDRTGNRTGGDLGIEVLESSFMGVDPRPVETPLKPGQAMRK
jgi:hypothetical protein